MSEIIVVGAGVCGLMIARELSRSGQHVIILEAASSAGGRIATSVEKEFSQPLETGAEFIHGNLPLTLQILKEAAIGYTPVTGEMTSFKNGSPAKDLESYEEEFLRKASELDRDTALAPFLDQWFGSDQSKGLRESITRYAQGFDLADPDIASVFALRSEWSEDEELQYRVDGGYKKLIEFLLNECIDQDVTFHASTIVREIQCNQDNVLVRSHDGKMFEGSKVIVTVSVGILQTNTIKFNPVPAQHLQAISQIGFGTVIKFLIEFKINFWEKRFPEAGFFISDEKVPTWWTQDSPKSNLLTGWLGGPPARLLAGLNEEAMMAIAVQSLSSIFSIAEEELTANIKQYKIADWLTNPFVKGAYSFSTVHTSKARELLEMPFDEKLFFAGEALWSGKSQGTVEAALQNGVAVSEKIIRLMK